MLDVRPTAYITPLAEQVLDDITPVVQVTSTGDEDAKVTGLIRIYRESTDQLLFASELATTIVNHHTTVNIAALSAWSPPAPADDDYFILCDTLAETLTPNHTDTITGSLGAWHFDIKPGPMGPAPSAHHTTHELGGMDELDVTGLTGVLADPQTLVDHVGRHEDGGADQLNVNNLHGELADPQPPKSHHADHQAGGSDRVLPVTVSIASDAAPSPDSDACDQYNVTALAEAATFGAPTGSPVDGQKLIIRILDDGTARALAWNAIYVPRGADLPTTSVISKYTYVGLIYNDDESTWDCVAVSQEA
jgi:hypothetical protein